MHIGLGWAVHPMSSVPRREKFGLENTERKHKEEGHVTVRTEIGVLYPAAKECQGMSATTRRDQRVKPRFFLEPLVASKPTDTY